MSTSIDDIPSRIGRTLFGAPKPVNDPSVFHRLSLVAFLAWVGLGADGLSSSAYGPEEAFTALGQHTYIAAALAVATAFTVALLSASYAGIIERFPGGGGGYVVASHLLGEKVGVVSGCALVVDYVLTITVSVASGGNAIFSFLPPSAEWLKMPVEIAAILVLITANIRGAKESVKMVLPIFLVFIATHALMIGFGILSRIDDLPEVRERVETDFSEGLSTLGWGGMLLIFLRAWSMGGGTYTGIEAVSNGMQIMREPRVQTGKRAMLYMAVSLAITAGGILIAYLLWDIRPAAGKTMNAVLAETLFAEWPLGRTLIFFTLLSEGLLLFVAAQAGFIDGPRVMANLAVDSFLPHRFGALSARLTMQNGVLMMGGAAMVVLLCTGGDIHTLVVMYSINVFATFTLSQLAMLLYWRQRRDTAGSEWHMTLHSVALAVCAGILGVTIYEKFGEGGWVTVIVTSLFVLICLAIREHYDHVRRSSKKLDEVLGALRFTGPRCDQPLQADAPTAVLLVGRFSGLGVHTFLNVSRFFPGVFRQVVFVSVAVVDSGSFKGVEEVEALQQQTRDDLAKYVDVARALGFAAEGRMEVGIEVVDSATELCQKVSVDFPKATVISGKLVFRKERWFQRLLHNETPVMIQQRLQWLGVPMVIIPVRAM